MRGELTTGLPQPSGGFPQCQVNLHVLCVCVYFCIDMCVCVHVTLKSIGSAFNLTCLLLSPTPILSGLNSFLRVIISIVLYNISANYCLLTSRYQKLFSQLLFLDKKWPAPVIWAQECSSLAFG